tara:strand:- start:299 stop:490 length:192 start_codon:yes stop_codon:yes gene_type:complete
MILSFLLFIGNAHAEIRNKKEAEEFLDKYCVKLVNGIEDAYKTQKKSIEVQDWKTFLDKGRWI